MHKMLIGQISGKLGKLSFMSQKHYRKLVLTQDTFLNIKSFSCEVLLSHNIARHSKVKLTNPIAGLPWRSRQEFHDLLVGRPGVQRAAPPLAADTVRLLQHRTQTPKRPSGERVPVGAGTARHRTAA